MSVTVKGGEGKYFLCGFGAVRGKRGGGAMYRVFRQLENGELVHVASRGEREKAAQLVESLKVLWPGEYEVRAPHARAVRSRSSADREIKTEVPV
jgi:hypothetical protein